VGLRKQIVERQAGGGGDGRRVIEFLTSEKKLDQLLGSRRSWSCSGRI